MGRTARRLVSRIMHIAVALVVSAGTSATAAAASGPPEKENVLTCQIQGQDKQVAIAISGSQVTYSYGAPLQPPELTLSSSLADLDYRRKSGAGDTFDEIVTFANGDTAYRMEAGFRSSDTANLQPFGLLTVSRAGRPIANLACRPDSIERVQDRLLARMRDSGRERTSDGQSFPNYAIQYPRPASQSPPCEADFNVDTCWSRGVGAARGGDLRGALGHYDMSCDANFNELGCYEAGKLYLHNRELRDYARARARFTAVCDSDDPGRGPYACKYLGWMHLTGTGVVRDLDKAWSTLASACILHNDAMMIDPEGCHFFARTVFEVRKASPARYATADFIAYVALSQACTDNARTVCEEAQALYRTGVEQGAAWIGQCDRAVRAEGAFPSCAAMTEVRTDYDAAIATRRKLMAMFLAALNHLS